MFSILMLVDIMLKKNSQRRAEMDVFEKIRKYYEETIDWEPDVKRVWR